MKNIGVSSLSSLVIAVDWFTQIYLLFEITYINAASYSVYDLVMIIIQTVCLSILLISYVFVPNYVVISDENLNLLGSKKKPNSSSNESALPKRSLFSQIIFAYFEGIKI